MVQILGDVELITKQEAEAMLNATVVTEDSIDSKITDAKNELNGNIATEKESLESSITTVSTALTSSVQVLTEADTNLGARIDEEHANWTSADNSLSSEIARIEGEYKSADAQLKVLIENETSERETLASKLEEFADRVDPELITEEISEAIATEVTNRNTAISEASEAVITKLKGIESETFEDGIKAYRFKNLPFAQLTVENTDRTIKQNDIIGTITDKYFPLFPVTFNFVTEIEPAQEGDPEYAFISARLVTNGNIIALNVTPVSEAFTGNINSATVMYITKE